MVVESTMEEEVFIGASIEWFKGKPLEELDWTNVNQVELSIIFFVDWNEVLPMLNIVVGYCNIDDNDCSFE